MRRAVSGPWAASALLILSVAACQQQPQDAAKGPAATEQAPAPAAISTAEPLKPGRYDKVLAITSDDGKTAIAEVLLDGIALKTEGLGTPKVKALFEADPEEGNGTPCESEGLEVRLANGVNYRPLTNFCNTKYELGVPAAKANLPRPLPAAPEDFVWDSISRGSDTMLYYGIPETDATAFYAECRKDSGRTRIKFLSDAGQRPMLDLYASDRVLRYDLQRSSEGSDEEAPTNSLDLGVDDAFWKELRRGALLPHRIDGKTFRTFDSRQGKGKIEDFLKRCSGK